MAISAACAKSLFIILMNNSKTLTGFLLYAIKQLKSQILRV